MKTKEDLITFLENFGFDYDVDTDINFDCRWYNVPTKIKEQTSYLIHTISTCFFFDKNDNFLGIGMGDEQSGFYEV